jgi:hypothetical protein
MNSRVVCECFNLVVFVIINHAGAWSCLERAFGHFSFHICCLKCVYNWDKLVLFEPIKACMQLICLREKLYVGLPGSSS